MLSDYTFLTDHSYSLRPDNDELSLNKREDKNKKRRRSSSRTTKTKSTSNRTVSIDRSSSDKENNSSSNNKSISPTNSSLDTTKKKPIGSRRSRLSTRTTMANSRIQSAKKQDNKISSKIGVKSTQGSIIKKKRAINRDKTKLLNSSKLDSSDALPSLSIEERVKLRRTKPIQPSTIIVEKKSNKSQNRPTKSAIKNSSKKLKPTTVKNRKLFLGSGLDLDNIVLGNRQRRCLQT